MKRKTKNAQISHLGYEELCQLGYQTAALMVTEMNEFERFGISQMDLDNFEIKLSEFADRSFDREKVLQQKLATIGKNEAADDLKLELFDLQVILVNRLGERNTLVKQFQLSSLSKIKDGDLIERVGSLKKIVEKSDNEVLHSVFTPEVIESLLQKMQILTEKIAEQATKKVERKKSTAVRLELAEEVYRTIVKFRTTGKQMWAYRDYVRSSIYAMPKRKAAPPDEDEDNDLMEFDAQISSETNNFAS